ncbi:ribosomal protein L14p/L23e [Dictyocaulus viviparus]|uniref:Large ribosomal subunit protein uL14m n=1 Tax=Dictyocaulus viviparus TaxID=29172 RepID=A0A0D8XE24_DICVI|nr:ribosomal protein L14p/L23e [Dictyocaulus viviparus]
MGTYFYILSGLVYMQRTKTAEANFSFRIQFCVRFSTTSSDVIVSTSSGDVKLVKEDAAPVYYKAKGEGIAGFDLVPWKNDEKIANYVLFEASMEKAKVSWKDYNNLTSDERTIYMKHLKAVQERKLTYKDPFTGYIVFTVCHHLYKGNCCGNGCRHCPYNLENATDTVKKSRVWNGAYYVYELSKHRSRPPVMGIHRRTRCNVVDNSALGKEAHISGKRAYCIDVYKQGRRKKHLPHATLGDKILVAIRGQMRKAYVVGANTHVHLRKHGIPVTDTNNIVLLDDEGNPLGNRIMVPIPAKLLENKNDAQFAKVLALANKFI